MFKNIKKDIKSRSKFFKNYLFLNLIHYIKSNHNYLKLNFFNIDKFLKTKVALKRFCFISGRSRGVNSKFRLSRIIFKKFIFLKVFSNFSKS